MGTTDRLDRPWAQGIGLLLLGLFLSAVANGVAMHGDPGPALRAAGALGYFLGVFVAGAGVHRVLWAGRTERRRSARLLVTALVTVPTFVGTALFFSLLFTILQIRFSY